MISGEALKKMLACIPDEAGITINGNWNVSIESVRVETTPNGWLADLQLTPGFSVTKDSVMAEMFKDLQTR